MQYRTLGNTGVRVSRICLGAMMFGSWGNRDRRECSAIIAAALDAGVNFIDTADVYSAGESEEIVGEALAGLRERVVLATKVHFPMSDDPNERGNSRRWIMLEVERQLRRLRTDWIDLLQIHRPEPETALEETLSALSDLVRQGKVRYVGSSTFPPSLIVEAQWVARERNLERFVCEQPPYSILARGIEAEVLPTAHRYKMGVITWSPLGGGWLSGRYGRGADPGQGQSTRAQRLPERFDLSLPANQRKLAVVEALQELAEEAGLALPRLAVAFVLNHPAVTSAIIGPRTLDQLTPLLDVDSARLPASLLDKLDELVPPGTNVNPADGGWRNPWLEPAARRHTL